MLCLCETMASILSMRAGQRSDCIVLTLADSNRNCESTSAVEVCLSEKKRWTNVRKWWPMPIKTKATLVIQRQNCPDNAKGLFRTDAPTVRRIRPNMFLQLVGFIWMGRPPSRIGCVLCLLRKGSLARFGERCMLSPETRVMQGTEKDL